MLIWYLFYSWNTFKQILYNFIHSQSYEFVRNSTTDIRSTLRFDIKHNYKTTLNYNYFKMTKLHHNTQHRYRVISNANYTYDVTPFLAFQCIRTRNSIFWVATNLTISEQLHQHTYTERNPYIFTQFGITW